MRNLILIVVVAAATSLSLSCHRCQNPSTVNQGLTKKEAKTMMWDIASTSDAKSSVFKVIAFGLDKTGEPVHISSGTAFAITPELFVTARHIIDGSLMATIKFDQLQEGKVSFALVGADGGVSKILFVEVSDDYDLAFLLADSKAIPIKTGTIFDAQKGDRVCLITASGHSLKGTRTYCGGILAIDHSKGDAKAEIHVVPGFSGSPVVNRRGELIGIVTATSRFEKTGFFIPVERMIEELLKLSQK